MGVQTAQTYCRLTDGHTTAKPQIDDKDDMIKFPES